MANDHYPEQSRGNLTVLPHYCRTRNRQSVVVLLVGRWSERIPILRILIENLEAIHYVPVAFDLELCKNTDTLVTLAHMSRFLLLDLTRVTYLPLRLQALIYRETVVVRPMLDVSSGCGEELMKWVVQAPLWALPLYQYRGQSHLSETLKAEVIKPLEEVMRERTGK